MIKFAELPAWQQLGLRAVALAATVLSIHPVFSWWEHSSFGDHLAAVSLLTMTSIEATILQVGFSIWRTHPANVAFRESKEALEWAKLRKEDAQLSAKRPVQAKAI